MSPSAEKPARPVYIKRFGRPLLVQAAVVTLLSPLFLFLIPDSCSWSNRLLIIAGVVSPFWLALVFWGRCSVEIDAEGIVIRKSGVRTYRWCDRPTFIFHRYTLLNRIPYLEIIGRDSTSDRLDDTIADHEFLNEIRKHAPIEMTDDLLPRGRIW